MELYEAIFSRKSTRKFLGSGMSDAELARVGQISESAERLYPEIPMQVHMVRDGLKIQAIMHGIIGSYGKIKAPHYLVVTSEDLNGYLENVGYTIEQVVLEMTRLGIATCWIGGHVDKQVLKSVLEIEGPQVPVVLIAFGYPEHPGDVYRSDPLSAKRKSLNEIVSGSDEWAWKDVIEAVRIAPSAANSQPWRLVLKNDLTHVFITRGNLVTQRLFGTINYVDAGIALCHLAIASRHSGKPVKIIRQSGMDRLDHIYIATAIRL